MHNQKPESQEFFLLMHNVNYSCTVLFSTFSGWYETHRLLKHKKESFENISKYDVSKKKNRKNQLGPSGAARISKGWQGLKHEMHKQVVIRKQSYHKKLKTDGEGEQMLSNDFLTAREELWLVQGKFLDELIEKIF